MLWSFLGFLSSIVGLVCYALSSSFKHLFGEWNRVKLLLYITISLITCSIVLFAKKIQVSKSFVVKSHVGFLVLMLTSLYSYFYDRAVNGKPDAFSIVSYTAFAFMSLCFSRKMELKFEVGLFNFFLGFLTVQLMKMSLVLAFVAVVFCYSLIVFRCYSDSQLEIGNGATRSQQHNVNIVIETTATQNDGVNEEASSTTNVGGERDCEENQQNMEEEREVGEEMRSFPSEIDSFHQYKNSGLRRRNMGKAGDWNCRFCNFLNSERSGRCQRCGDTVANARERDPSVDWRVGDISYLENRVAALQMQLAVAQAELLCNQMEQEPTKTAIPIDRYQQMLKSVIPSDKNSVIGT